MRTRGRKSADALTVVAGTFGERPEPPSELSKEQKDCWRRIVGSEPADFFRTEAQKAALIAYCRHSVTADELEKVVHKAMGPGAKVDLEALDRLLKMRERETRTCITLATKMRLTNQSRYNPGAADTAGRQAAPTKPWQDVG